MSFASDTPPKRELPERGYLSLKRPESHMVAWIVVCSVSSANSVRFQGFLVVSMNELLKYYLSLLPQGYSKCLYSLIPSWLRYETLVYSRTADLENVYLK